MAKESEDLIFKGIEMQVLTEWFDEDAIRPTPYHVGRVPISDSARAYFRMFGETPEDWTVKFYCSLTTALYYTMPTPLALEMWRMGLGAYESKRKTEVAKHYGTMMHQEIAKYCRSKQFNFSKVNEIISNYCEKNDFFQPECRYEWPVDLQQDLCAWIKFAEDVSLKVIAVELVLVSEVLGIGTAIDVVGTAFIDEDGPTGELYKSGPRQGEQKIGKVPTKRNIIINMKSGRKGIWETHVTQMNIEKKIFEENYPEIKLDYCFNWSPNSWRTSDPTYKFVNQTGKTTDEEIAAIAALVKMRFTDGLMDKQKIGIFGEYSEGNSIEKNIRAELLIDYIKRRRFDKMKPKLYEQGDE